jgi:hypothetical protein
MKLFRTRPRRLAVALFAFGGSLLGAGGAMVPATAHPEDGKCIAAKAWIYWSDQGRQTVLPYTCVDRTETHTDMYVPVIAESNTPPTGMPGGAGVELWVPTP